MNNVTAFIDNLMAVALAVLGWVVVASIVGFTAHWSWVAFQWGWSVGA